MAEVAETATDDDTLTVIEPDAADDADEALPPSEAEKVARLMGWKPLDKWKGDKAGWKAPEDFLAEVPEIMRNTRKANQRLEGQITRIVGQLAKLQSGQDRQTNASLDKAMDAAVEAGDLEGARKILASAQAQKAAPDEHPAFTAFKDRNDEWWGVDDEATAYAESLDKRFAKDGIADPEIHMKKVEAGVKKRFPELFGDAKADDDTDPPAKTVKETPRAPLVARGGRGAGQSSSDKLTPATMSPKQREAAKSMNVDPKDYCKSYNDYYLKDA